MFAFIKNLFKSKNQRYAEQRRDLAGGDPKKIRRLAEDGDTHPEILYFLAKNDSPEVRKAIAKNKATPVQASTLLATDKNVDVRLALAARLVELLPELTPDKHSQLYAYTVQALGMLAQDEIFMVRKALSSTLKDYTKAPPAVVGKLARDIEREISEPILRYCAALSDDDLLDILSQHPEPWVISAIAGRGQIKIPVTDAVIDTEDMPATTILINNRGAEFSGKTLQKIIDRARNYPEWHKPIALRPEITLELGRQLTGFVDKAVMNLLQKRSDFDAATRKGIANIVKRRLSYQVHNAPEETLPAKLERYAKSPEGITPELLTDALSWHEIDFVTLAIARLAKIPPDIVTKMIKSGAAKPIVALCWKAKLPMRFCVDLQMQGAKIQPKDLLYARGGTDYPLSDDEIKWQLEFFGVS